MANDERKSVSEELDEILNWSNRIPSSEPQTDEFDAQTDELMKATSKMVKVVTRFHEELSESGLSQEMVDGMTMMFMARLISPVAPENDQEG